MVKMYIDVREDYDNEKFYDLSVAEPLYRMMRGPFNNDSYGIFILLKHH